MDSGEAMTPYAFRGGSFLLIHPIGGLDAKHTNRDATFPRRQTDMSAHIRRTLWNGFALSVHRLQTDASGAYGGVYIHFIVPYLSVVRSSLPTRKLR